MSDHHLRVVSDPAHKITVRVLPGCTVRRGGTTGRPGQLLRLPARVAERLESRGEVERA
jgi:hypothetical protein